MTTTNGEWGRGDTGQTLAPESQEQMTEAHGMFWEALRLIANNVFPRETGQESPGVKAWADLTPNQRRLFCALAREHIAEMGMAMSLTDSVETIQRDMTEAGFPAELVTEVMDLVESIFEGMPNA